jgi:hypothetical protein
MKQNLDNMLQLLDNRPERYALQRKTTIHPKAPSDEQREICAQYQIRVDTIVKETIFDLDKLLYERTSEADSNTGTQNAARDAELRVEEIKHSKVRWFHIPYTNVSHLRPSHLN